MEKGNTKKGYFFTLNPEEEKLFDVIVNKKIGDNEKQKLLQKHWEKREFFKISKILKACIAECDIHAIGLLLDDKKPYKPEVSSIILSFALGTFAEKNKLLASEVLKLLLQKISSPDEIIRCLSGIMRDTDSEANKGKYILLLQTGLGMEIKFPLEERHSKFFEHRSTSEPLSLLELITKISINKYNTALFILPQNADNKRQYLEYYLLHAVRHDDVDLLDKAINNGANIIGRASELLNYTKSLETKKAISGAYSKLGEGIWGEGAYGSLMPLELKKKLAQRLLGHNPENDKGRG